MKIESNLNVRVPTELIKEAQLIKQQTGTNWSYEVRRFLERRIEELKSKPTTNAKAQ